MNYEEPRPLILVDRRARERRAANIAHQLGFVGSIEYRHVTSQTGGAQFGRGKTAKDDLLTVYAEAFERDSDPEDFSLSAMIAHECGHQLLARHPRIARRVEGISNTSEEILASLLGAMICYNEIDRNALFARRFRICWARGKTPTRPAVSWKNCGRC